MLVSIGTGFLGLGVDTGFLGLDAVQVFWVLVAHREAFVFQKCFDNHL